MQVQNQINKGINLTTDLYNIALLSFQILIQPVQQNDSDKMVNALISFYDSDLNKNQLKAKSLVNGDDYIFQYFVIVIGYVGEMIPIIIISLTNIQ